MFRPGRGRAGRPHLIGRGVLTRAGATYRVPEVVPVLEVPETLHALIAARLDSLPAAERNLVQNASVLGKTFTLLLGRRIGPGGHMFKMGLDLGLDIAFDSHALPKVEEILAAIEGLRPGEITPSLRGIEARARARLAAHRGQRDLAESMFKSAAAMFRDLGMRLWVATTLAEQAEWLRQEERSPWADQIGEEAAAIFERLGAKPWLRRVTGATTPPVQVSSEPIG
jgi:hypothetical protein